MDSSQIRDWILRTAERNVGIHREDTIRLTRDEREMVLRLYESRIPRSPTSISQSCNMCWMNSALGLTLFPRSEHLLKYLRQKLASKEPCVDVVFAYVLVIGFGGYAGSEADAHEEPVDRAFLACLDQHGREQEDVGRGVHNIAHRFGIALDAFRHTRVNRWRSLASPDRIVKQTQERIILDVLNPEAKFEDVLATYVRETPVHKTRAAFTEVYSDPTTWFYHNVVYASGDTKPSGFKGKSYTPGPLMCFPMRQEILLPCFFSSRMYADTDKEHAEYLNSPVHTHDPKDRRFMWKDDEILVCSNAHVREVREGALKYMLKNWLRLVEELGLYSEEFRDCASELAEAARAAFASDLSGYVQAKKLKDGGGVSIQEMERAAGVKVFDSYIFGGGSIDADVDDDMSWRTLWVNSESRALLTTLHEVCAAARVFEFPARIACMQDGTDDAFVNGNPLFKKLMGVIRGADAFRRIGELAKHHAQRMRTWIQESKPKMTKPWYDTAMVMRCIEDGLQDVTRMRLTASRDTELMDLYQQNILGDLSPQTPGSVLFLNLSREGVARNPIKFMSTEVKIGPLDFEIIGAAIPQNKSGKQAGHWYVVVKDPGADTYFWIDSLHGRQNIKKKEFLTRIQRASILLLQIPVPRTRTSSETGPDAATVQLIRRIKSMISQPRQELGLVVVA
jgi:hypothetical protein